MLILQKHNFGSSVLDRLKDLVKEGDFYPPPGKSEDDWRAENYAALTPAQRYDHACFFSWANVTNAETRVELASVLLKRSPRSLRLRDEIGARHVWLDYHVAQFTAGLISLSDSLLILTADVCRLGLDPRDCTLDVLKRHQTIRGIGLVNQLKKISSVTQKHREVRNRVLHRGDEADLAQYVDAEVARLAKAYSIITTDKNATSEWRRRERLIWKAMLDTAVPKLESERQIITTEAERLLTMLSRLCTQTHNAIYSS